MLAAMLGFNMAIPLFRKKIRFLSSLFHCLEISSSPTFTVHKNKCLGDNSVNDSHFNLAFSVHYYSKVINGALNPFKLRSQFYDHNTTF